MHSPSTYEADFLTNIQSKKVSYLIPEMPFQNMIAIFEKKKGFVDLGNKSTMFCVNILFSRLWINQAFFNSILQIIVISKNLSVYM